jgi:REP element-mobilizing transposase RayT
MSKYANKYRIESTRLQNWNYGWNAAYYVTICTLGRKHFFGNIHQGDMYLSKVGQFAKNFWHEIPNHFSFVRLGAFVVMPNHIHGIVVIDKPYGFDDDPVSVGAVDTRHCLVSTPTAQSAPPPTTPTTAPPAPTDSIDQKTTENITDPTNPKITQNQSEQNKTPGQKRFQNQGKNTLSSIIGSYKSVVTKNARKIIPGFGWQSRFHDHIIRDKKAHSNISRYIENNPVNWKDDRFKK